ncbi:MAG: hypothetical protein HZA61_09825 [Candidatus Eisenbacteria bacterium]|uniref:Zf-HC2 domain-containing protein n=1 Tax=Eiseniibacteriota bacterium TaxID=2212470 RepID=A0A933SCD5_UNCEI|nr:hypothetical protein [Candidatus Eisenbacteria bacterium]
MKKRSVQRPSVPASKAALGRECPSSADLYRGAAGQLPLEQAGELMFHVTGCPKCALRMATARRACREAIESGVAAGALMPWLKAAPRALTAEQDGVVDRLLASLRLVEFAPAEDELMLAAAASKRAPAVRLECRAVDAKGKLLAKALRHTVVVEPTIGAGGTLSLTVRLADSAARYAQSHVLVRIEYRARGARAAKEAVARGKCSGGRLRFEDVRCTPALKGALVRVQLVFGIPA